MIKQKKTFDVLLFCMLVLFPLITRFIRYDSGLSGYAWAPADRTAIDFYVYYKSRFFLAVCLGALLALLGRLIFKRESLRYFSVLGLLVPWLFLMILSTVFSVSPEISIKGITDHFESVFVWIGYVVWFVYVCEAMREEEDYTTVLKWISLSVISLAVVGILQLTGNGLLGNEWIKRLAMSASDYKNFGSQLESAINTGAIPLTFDNPNYAGVYLAMLASFLFVVVMLSKEREKRSVRIFLTALLLAVLILLLYTYSRAALVGVAGAIILFFLVRRPSAGQWAGIVIVVVVLIVADGIRGFDYLERLTATVETVLQTGDEQNLLKNIETTEEAVMLEYGQETLSISADGNELVFRDESGNDISSQYAVQDGRLNRDGVENLRFYPAASGDGIILDIEDELWEFVKTEDGYVFINDFGREEVLKKVPTAGFEGFERIGSGRGYIWSRTLPLLSEYWLSGSGPDTFMLAFPQNDRVGKSIYCRERYTIMEKPHNMYLQIAVQNGILALLLFLVFYGSCFWYSLRCSKHTGFRTMRDIVAFAALVATFCYMLCAFFVDSTVQASPLFWTCLGLAAGVVNVEKKTIRK